MPGVREKSLIVINSLTNFKFKLKIIMVTLYTTPFEKRYTARFFTCSTFFVGILFLLTIIIPYIIVYLTNGKYPLFSFISLKVCGRKKISISNNQLSTSAMSS